jgi:hypothetical protein
MEEICQLVNPFVIRILPSDGRFLAKGLRSIRLSKTGVHIMRDIQDILHFREDISPFLVHLTRDKTGGLTASVLLKHIIASKELIPGASLVSDARFGLRTASLSDEQKKRSFSAICFTETPLNEIHCLLEISSRKVALAPFGLVFMKNALMKLGVSPVLYLNNLNADKDAIIKALCSLRESHPAEAEQLLPLLAIYGQKLQPPGARTRSAGIIDFQWEREWRYPAVGGNLHFAEQDVFVGLCPHDEIAAFERLFPPVGFVDPRRNMKWYATTLIEARQRLDIKYSVL